MQRPTSVQEAGPEGRGAALGMSTLAFTVCFAVWTIFSIIGMQIKKDLGLNDTQFGLLVGTPILTGSLIRLMLGIWADQYGGRIVYVGRDAVGGGGDLAADLRLRLSDLPAGRARRRHRRRLVRGRHRLRLQVVSRRSKQGTALGIFGAGNVGAAVTKFVAPFIMVAYGWKAVADVWAVALAVMAVVFWLDDQGRSRSSRRGAQPGRSPSRSSAMLEPLKQHPGLALLALLLLRLRRASWRWRCGCRAT